MWEKKQDLEKLHKHLHEDHDLDRGDSHNVASLFKSHQDSIKMLEKQQREDRSRAEALTREHERVHEEFQKSNDGPSL